MSTRRGHPGTSRILISPVSVRWTGHISAISRSRARCSSSSGPESSFRRSIRSIRPRRVIVTAGCGWVQRQGGRVEEVRPGDVVWFPPGEKHWHGATATTAMTHIAIQEKLDGTAVDWMEHVADDQFQIAD